LARNSSTLPAYRREALETPQKTASLDSLSAAARFQIAELHWEMNP
jgi:hypothetical protein